MPRFVYRATDSEGNQIPVIGYQISWSFGRKEYNQQAVIDAHIRNNLPIDHLQKGQKRIVATKRALNKMKGDGLLREIESNDSFMRFQFCEEFIDSLPSGSTFKNLRVREIIKFENDRFSFEDSNGTSYTNDLKASDIMRLVQHCSNVFTTADITRYTQKLFEHSSITRLKKDGGSYFVPAQHRELVENVKKMFDEIDPDGWFTLYEMVDTNFTKNAIKSSFESDLEQKVKTIRDYIAERKEKGLEMTRTVFSNFMKDDVAVMVGDLELYADLVQDQLADAKSLINEVTEEIKKEMLG